MTKNDFVALNIYILFRKGIVRFVMAIGLLSLLNIMLFPFPRTEPSFKEVFIPIIIMAQFPLITYFAAKKNFNAKNRLRELILYEFRQHQFAMTGESFSQEVSWEKIFKVTKSKKWLLVWQSRNLANGIPLELFQEEELASLKSLLLANNIRNNL